MNGSSLWLAIVESGIDMWIQEKKTNEKVILPLNFSNSPIFETLEQNISLTFISGITLTGILLNIWFFFNRKSIANGDSP